MNKLLGPNLTAAELRRRAEEQLTQRGGAGAADRSAVETARLVHELQVHQIELEMQNDALEQTREEMEALLENFIDLYDNAPVGYITLDRFGTIVQANLPAARLLGVDRVRLGQPRFGFFLSPADRKPFADFLEAIFANGTAEPCRITLVVDGHTPLAMRVEGSRFADSERCRLVLVTAELAAPR